MEKLTYFASRFSKGWPDPEEIERYFLAPPGQRWFFETGNDSAHLRGIGAEGTEQASDENDRIDIYLQMWGHPELGVLLIYSKWGGGLELSYASKGDMRRLGQWVANTHDDLLPVGLFVPFEVAWRAVKEFIEADGALPNSIEWVTSDDLPPKVFPAP